MDLLVSLAIVDEMHGGKQMRQLANGWMGREARPVRRLRALSARALIGLAARLDSAVAVARREDAALTPTNPA